MINDINKKYERIVVIDAGKNTVKTLVFTPAYKLMDHFTFPSKSILRQNFHDIDSSSEFQLHVGFEGHKYLVGEGISSDYNFETTKNNLHHKLCIYSAIGKAVKDKSKILLIIGCPSSDYANLTQRQAFVDNIKGKGVINITVNGEEKSITLCDVMVQPEGVATKPRVEDVGKRALRIVDIGGENINVRAYDDKANTMETFSLDGIGVNHLESYMKTCLRKNIKADAIDIESLNYKEAIKEGNFKELRDDDFEEYKTVKDFVSDVMNAFIKKNILDKLMSKGLNLDRRGYPTIITGGGSVLLKLYLEDLLQNNKENLIFSKTAYWDNAISYTIKDIGDRCKKASGDFDTNLKFAQSCGVKILKESGILRV